LLFLVVVFGCCFGLLSWTWQTYLFAGLLLTFNRFFFTTFSLSPPSSFLVFPGLSVSSLSWTALEKCELTDAVKNMGNGLESKVAEYGENMSQGQRQLLCLGRALLRNCKLLLLDEATSSIDRVTDTLVQKTIRSSFQGVTILTIAHRVETIIDSDLIMVMDDGKVAELDTPKALLSDDNGLFNHIVKEMGDDIYKDLKIIACGAGDM
jgi:ABC-type sugar transport system ATPase subunit